MHTQEAWTYLREKVQKYKDKYAPHVKAKKEAEMQSTMVEQGAGNTSETKNTKCIRHIGATSHKKTTSDMLES